MSPYLVIVEIEIEGEAVTLGSIADSVNQVAYLPEDEIQSPPSIGTFVSTEFILGMAKLDEEFVTILDVDRIFSKSEFILGLASDTTRLTGEPDGDSQGESQPAASL